MAALEKQKGMSLNIGPKSAGMAAILWLAMQSGATGSAANEATVGREQPAGKPKSEKSRAQKTSKGKTQPGKRIRSETADAPTEAVLCDGVPFGPAVAPDVGGGNR